jgi:hypothetical protein
MVKTYSDTHSSEYRNGRQRPDFSFVFISYPTIPVSFQMHYYQMHHTWERDNCVQNFSQKLMGKHYFGENGINVRIIECCYLNDPTRHFLLGCFL